MHDQYATPVAQKEPRVIKKLAELYACLELLEKSIAQLNARLVNVSTPPTPDQTQPVNPINESCLMADQLQGLIRHAETLRDQVDSMIVRLEV